MKIRSKTSHDIFLRNINPVVKFLILSDVLVVGATGMLAPLFALFIEDYIIGSSAMVVSVAMGVFLISRSLLQIPIATLIDKIKGEEDDFNFMFIFSVLMALTPLLYLYIKTPVQLYLVQALLGVFTAITYPSYMAIFTRHVDKNREGTEWGIYYTMTDLGSAFLAVLGGYVAETFGFPQLISLVVIISLLGAFTLSPIRYYLYKN
ncbi:MAG: MFS transporter [Candidatus Pacebacteria bacterium]|nr:MFS transporter [Candidatus Paceibacterota bacterium]